MEVRKGIRTESLGNPSIKNEAGTGGVAQVVRAPA
jgi:hypothetical protein